MSATDNNPNTPAPKKPRSLGRRLFLISAGLVGGGVLLGAGYITNKRNKSKSYALPAPVGGGMGFGPWLTLDAKGIITAHCPHQEMGQGTTSLMASLIAEELDANPAQMRVEHAAAVPAYSNPTMILDSLPFADDDTGIVATAARATMRHVIEAFGVNGTGGSTGARNITEGTQRAAASLRGVLLDAAGKRLGVSTSELTIERGIIRHASSNRSLSFGDVAIDAGNITPRELTPKARSAYTMIGKTGMPRLDVPSKVDGSAQYGIDVRLPGQLYAAIKHCPVFGGTVKSVAFAPKTPAIKSTVQGKTFVAAVATSWYAAKQYLEQAQVVWDEGALANVSSADIFASYGKAIDANKGDVFETRGEPGRISAGAVAVKAEYRVPYLAHATMEPMNCTVWLKRTAGVPVCDVWAGNQSPIMLRWGLGQLGGRGRKRPDHLHTDAGWRFWPPH